MADAEEFLAEEVLVEKKVITYRYLSRALKIHVNVAKRALFDFHAAQNAKKADSLHATYLLYGTKAQADEPSSSQNGGSGEGDVDMEDSLPEYLQSEQVSTTVMTLVAEENLESALSQYATLDAIHVYSVSPQPMNDLQLLADTTRQLRELRGASAPEEASKTFGTIPNSHVRRRQRRGQAPITAASASTHALAATPSSTKAAKPVPDDTPGPNSIWNKVKAPAKDDIKLATTSSKLAADSAAPENTETKKPVAAAASSVAATPPTLKKAGSSGGGGIMQAFAKGASAAKPKKKEPHQPAKKAAEEDAAMGMSDDGGDEDNDEDIMPKAQQVTGGKSRKERQEELRKMMDEDDDDDDAEDEKDEDEDEREDTSMEDVEEDKPAEPAASAPAKDDGPSEVVTASSGDGRRRGKRRVMRKKMIEDKDGYLVTIQKPDWESFSEDEAPPKVAASAAATALKPKKPAPKAGQGNIMSFFAKK